MEMATIIEFVTTVGFPIVLCFILLQKNDKFAEAINNNTIVITKLLERIGEDE